MILDIRRRDHALEGLTHHVMQYRAVVNSQTWKADRELRKASFAQGRSQRPDPTRKLLLRKPESCLHETT